MDERTREQARELSIRAVGLLSAAMPGMVVVVIVGSLETQEAVTSDNFERKSDLVPTLRSLADGWREDSSQAFVLTPIPITKVKAPPA